MFDYKPLICELCGKEDDKLFRYGHMAEVWICSDCHEKVEDAALNLDPRYYVAKEVNDGC